MSKNCYLCHSDKISVLDGKVRDNNNLNMLVCNNCSLAFLSSFDHISNTFYEDGKMLPENSKPAEREKYCYNDDFRRFKLLKKIISNKIIIDFGAGSGGFLKLARNIAKECYGVELDTRLRKYMTEQNIRAFDTIDSCPKADVITLFHTLEHIKDPITFLSDLRSHLKDSGSQIIIEVPNVNDALISLYKSNDFLNFTWWSCHLFSYNPKTLKEVVTQAGYKINSFKQIQRYGLINHIYWLIKGKPKGDKIYPKLNNKFINFIYEKILSFLGKTDTLLISISPE